MIVVRLRQESQPGHPRDRKILMQYSLAISLLKLIDATNTDVMKHVAENK